MNNPAIYAIRLSGTQKVYVGSSSDWKRRTAEHRTTLRGGRHCNPHLQHAWKKYGEDAFEFSVLERLHGVDQIVEREQHWIDTLQAATEGFNMCPAAGTTRGLPCSPEKKAKISRANTGRQYSEAAKERIRMARAAQVITPESTAKTRAANVGKKRSAEFCARISAARSGVPKSAEQRAKMAAASTGKKASAQTKAKMSASAKGKVKSPEHRANLSAALTGRKLSPETVAKRQATRRANQAPAT